jgi:hypothetical protein
MEDPGYGKLSVQTLLEVAATFDVALLVRFVSHSEFLQRTRDISEAAFQVPSFKDDSFAKAALADNYVVTTTPIRTGAAVYDMKLKSSGHFEWSGTSTIRTAVREVQVTCQ